MTEWLQVAQDISSWIRQYTEKNSIKTLVVGASGGIDSAVTSTLCANTGMETIVLNMPIYQDQSQYDLSKNHIEWLQAKWPNIDAREVDLTSSFDSFRNDLKGNKITDLALANSRARLRMATLYAIAGSNDGIVVGTGNRVEDFGVGFFTKYGDGGVDISPIADLYKSEVYSLGEELGILKQILEAPPTDGLWDDGRTDEDQMGASYSELEWAMSVEESKSTHNLSSRELEVLGIYRRFNEENKHKMSPIPIFQMKRD